MKFLLTLSCVIGIVVTFYACTKSFNGTDPQSPVLNEGDRTTVFLTVPDSNAILSGYADVVAAYHNPGVEANYNAIYTQIGTVGIKNATTAGLVLSVLNTATNTYLTNSGYNTGGITYEVSSTQSVFNFRTQSLGSYIQSTSGYTLSTTLKNALDQVQDIVTSYSDTTLIKTYLNDVLVLTLPDLSNTTEKLCLLGAIKIGMRSAVYWDMNYNKWRTLMQGSLALAIANGFTTSSEDPDWEQISKDAVFADITGAAVGAVRGALTGAAGGTFTIPGVGTVAGAAGGGLIGMAAGAIGGSASSVGWDLIKSFIGW